jgi:ankyrin repeat protein
MRVLGRLAKVLWMFLIAAAAGLIAYELPEETFQGFCGVNRSEDKTTDRMLFWIHRRDAHQLRYALDRGADPNMPDMSGLAPLMHAIQNEWTEGCHILLEHGARPDAPVADRAFALHLAVIHRGDNIPDIVRLLLGHGAPVDAATPRLGHTPLAFAIRYNGRADVVQILLAAGADIDRPDNDGVTPRHYLPEHPEAARIQQMLDQ